MVAVGDNPLPRLAATARAITEATVTAAESERNSVAAAHARLARTMPSARTAPVSNRKPSGKGIHSIQPSCYRPMDAGTQR